MLATSTTELALLALIFMCHSSVKEEAMISQQSDPTIQINCQLLASSYFFLGKCCDYDNHSYSLSKQMSQPLNCDVLGVSGVLTVSVWLDAT